MKRLFSIGEAAEFAGVTRRIILNYEAHDLLMPDRKDGQTGNRFYTIDTLTQIRTIRSLQKLGLSLDEIHDYLHNSTDLSSMIRRLEALRDEIDQNIRLLYERIDQGFIQIEEITMPSQTIYSKTMNAPTIAMRTDLLRNTALEAFQTYGSAAAEHIYFTDSPLDGSNEISFGVVIPSGSTGEHVTVTPPMRAICLYHHGPYEQIPIVRKQLLIYAKQKELRPMGFFRHIYLEGPPQHKDSRHFITQILLPIQ